MKYLLLILLSLATYQAQSQTFEDLTGGAIKAYMNKQYRESINLFNKALKMDTGNHYIYNRLARVYYEIDKLDSAILYLSMTLQQLPGDTEALYMRGHCYKDNNEFQKGLDDFMKSFQLTGRKNADACFNVGMCLLGLGKPDKASEYFKLTLDLQPGDKYSLFELGYCYAASAKPDKEKALEYYNKAIVQDSNYYDVYLNRGLLYAVQFKDMKKAHQDLERSIQIRPKNKLSYMYNGMLYRDEEEFGKAKDMYNTVIDMYPDYAATYFERAVAWYGIGILNMVCRDLEKAESLGYSKAKEYKKSVCK